MDEATLAQTIMTAAIFVIFLGYLIWGIRSGQFKNVEEAKYNMFPGGHKKPEQSSAPLKEVERKP